MKEGTAASLGHRVVTETERVGPGGQALMEACQARDILDRIADKWSLLVIARLEGGTRRFTELKRELDGISQRMLTVTLRQLERDGLVRRTVYPVVPPRVEYALTPLGITLQDSVRTLVEWTVAHRAEIAAAQAAYDARAGAGG